MEKNERNKKLAILVGTLLLVVGVSFAYFTGVSDTRGNGNIAEGNITVIKGAELNVQGKLEFNDTGIFPGHKNVSSIKVTATGNNELVPYNLIWTGTNELNTPLNFTVYKTSTEIEVAATCEKKNKVENNVTHLSEECTISNIEQLGSIIATGTIETSNEERKVILAEGEFITATKTGEVVYYYIILEYPNLDEEQNIDMGKTFDGIISVEEGNASPDISIVATYIKQDNGTYKKSSDIPQSGYALNKEKSTCTNNTIPEWKESKLQVAGYTKQGTQCELYFDESKASDTILGDITPNPGSNSFTGVETGNKGIFTGTDNDGTTYYYRGAVTNNYLKFAGFWWRIIRINGDGTIRIIYDGAVYLANGTSTVNSIAVAKKAFNSSNNDNAYVGFMYGQTGASTYEATHANTNKSNIMTELETWYTNKLASYADKIDTNAGFCGDRSMNTGSETWWDNDTRKGYGTNATAYGPFSRFFTTSNSWASTQTPTFKCLNSNDLYTVKGATKGNKAMDKPIGLITADEIVYAGGFGGKSNSYYYLYNGQDYWTMSPYYAANAFIFSASSIGSLSYNNASGTRGVRPVINLRADVPITGIGTRNDPFVVS